MLPQLMTLPSSARNSMTQSEFYQRRSSIKQLSLTPLRSASIEDRLKEDHSRITNVIQQYMEIHKSGLRMLESNISQLQNTNSLLDNQIKSLKELTKSKPKVAKKIHTLKEKYHNGISFVKGSKIFYCIASKLKYSPLKFSIALTRCTIC